MNMITMAAVLVTSYAMPFVTHGASNDSRHSTESTGSRADCQTSTQVSPTAQIICGEADLCLGAPGATQGCYTVRISYGTDSYYEWCDCQTPEDIWDTGPCHAAVWKVGPTNPSRSCVGDCGGNDTPACQLEPGTHTYKRCTCQ